MDVRSYSGGLDEGGDNIVLARVLVLAL